MPYQNCQKPNGLDFDVNSPIFSTNISISFQMRFSVFFCSILFFSVAFVNRSSWQNHFNSNQFLHKPNWQCSIALWWIKRIIIHSIKRNNVMVHWIENYIMSVCLHLIACRLKTDLFAIHFWNLANECVLYNCKSIKCDTISVRSISLSLTLSTLYVVFLCFFYLLSTIFIEFNELCDWQYEN